MPDLLRQTRFIELRTLVETSAHALFRGIDGRSGRRVVLKSASPTIGTTLPEAKALRALRGKGVVGLVPVLGRPAHTLALEEVAGPTLETKIRRARLSEADLEILASALFGVLTRIWAAGWVHGDIKPSNIVLERGDFRRPVLVDLECAARIGGRSASRLSAPFAAPERVMGGASAQITSDVFSLGATLYACVRGASPFAGASGDASLVRVLTHEPPSLDELSPRLSRQVAAMLAKDPAHRPVAWAHEAPRSAQLASKLRTVNMPPRSAVAPTVPHSMERTLRDLAPGKRVTLRGPDVARALRGVSHWAHFNGDLALSFAPSLEPYGSISSGLSGFLRLDAGLGFSETVALLRARIGSALARDGARQLVLLLGVDPDADSRRALEPFRVDAVLLRRIRFDALTAALGAAAAANGVVTVPRGIDAQSRAVLEASSAKLRLVVEEGALEGHVGKVVRVGERAFKKLGAALGELGVSPVLGPGVAEDMEAVASRLLMSEQPLRAAYYAWRGAERAFEASDLKRATSLADLADQACSRGVGPARKLISALVSVTRARIGRWTEDFDFALTATRRALASLPSGSASYCDALAERALIAGKRSDLSELEAVARALVDPPGEDAEVLWDRAASRTAVQLYYLGATRQADDLVRLFLQRTTLASGKIDERRRGLSPGALITHAQFHGRLDEYLQRLTASVSAFRAIGDIRSECLYGSALGFAYSQLGRHRRAVSILEAVRRKAVVADIPSLLASVDHNLGEALGHLPSRMKEAIEVETRAVEALRRDGDVRLLAGSLAYRARMHLARGELDLAERDANEAVILGRLNASLGSLIFATLAFVELARQRHEPAEETARRAVDSVTHSGAVETGHALAHFALAAALNARGDAVGSRKSAQRALRDVERRAANIEDRLLRESFLERVPEHRGLRRLSRAIR